MLVPITVFQAKGHKTFSILDGERRYRCVKELTEEGNLGKDGKPMRLPANVVDPPTRVAGLLYMFSIHNIREAWELMPTALGLQEVMKELGQADNKKLAKLTGFERTPNRAMPNPPRLPGKVPKHVARRGSKDTNPVQFLDRSETRHRILPSNMFP